MNELRPSEVNSENASYTYPQTMEEEWSGHLQSPGWLFTYIWTGVRVTYIYIETHTHTHTHT